jgi:tetraacyldisaccharide 4'-kinase
MQKRRSIFLYPFSLMYGLITGIRNFLYNTGIIESTEFQIPVICVGNLAVGGTGKTPHTEYLVGLLKQEFNVAVLSRGYKRKTRGFLLDDGFQHRSITPGYSILLSTYDNLMINDHLLPYGNLRESVINMRRADIILITRSPESLSAIQRRITVKDINKALYQNLYFTSVTYGKPLPVFESKDAGDDIFPNIQVKNTGIVLVTGIADPGPLTEYLREKVGELINISFGDHHRYNNNDIEKIKDAWGSLKSSVKYLITTEKDAVRLREFANIAEPFRSAFYYIPVGIHFLNDDREEFDNLITEYVRKNKQNNRIS